MKKHYLIFIGIIILLGCNKHDIPTYEDLTSDRYIYFRKKEIDSSEVSFLFYPKQTEIMYPIEIIATGVGHINQNYKISVVQEHTTAPTETYRISESYTMRQGLRIDTCFIKLIYNEILDNTKVRLVLRLEDSEDFLVKRPEFRIAIIWFHNVISKPKWWTSDVSEYYLGIYSDKKYKLFLDIIGVDLKNANDHQLRQYSLLFKDYLKKKKDMGETIYEDDGSEMTVSVLGNLI